jgi:hypothetical protein
MQIVAVRLGEERALPGTDIVQGKDVGWERILLKTGLFEAIRPWRRPLSSIARVAPRVG